jgi:hypothetical protein
MSSYLMGGLLAAIFAVQTGSTPAPAPAAKNAAKTLTLNGCIARDRLAPGQFTFLETEGGSQYRLTGKGLKDFVGKRVEIVGGPPGKGVTFRTGLLPSPNTAAQAGALDPAKAAVANLPGGAADSPGNAPLPEFKVVRLRGVDGACQ